MTHLEKKSVNLKQRPELMYPKIYHKNVNLIIKNFSVHL